MQLNLYIHRENAILSLDTSGKNEPPFYSQTLAESIRIHYLFYEGAPLYKRGYKELNSEASLAENLAAALLQIAGWTNERYLAENTVFCDPFVGSGTILAEVSIFFNSISHTI